MADSSRATLAALAASLKKVGIRSLYLSTNSLDIINKTQMPGKSKSKPVQPTPPEKPGGSSAASKVGSQSTAAAQPFIRAYPAADPGRSEENRKKLAALEKPLHSCQACRLGENRTNLVYGVGSSVAALMFVGEGPGAEEDRKGEPFVGRAGQLLTEMITKGLRIRREDVYIANVVKCRPPENRTPLDDEIEACSPNLFKQIEIIQPQVIVTLGAVAAKTVLQSREGLTRIRGTWKKFGSIPVMPTYHPAYLLRNPNAKRDVWEDLKKVIAFFNGEEEQS